MDIFEYLFLIRRPIPAPRKQQITERLYVDGVRADGVATPAAGGGAPWV